LNSVKIDFMRKMAVLSVVLLLTACHGMSARDQGALGGAAAGAGTGAAIGSQTGGVGVGTAVGAGAGAVTGATIGHTIDTHEDRTAEQIEIMKRQEREMKRQKRELEDLRRQDFYNRQMRDYKR